MLYTTFTVLVVVLAAALLYAQPRYEETLQCVDVQTRDKLRSMTLEALDTSLRNQIEHSFSVWMKDNREQPERARRGIGQAIRAYVQVSKSSQEWEPPLCN